MYSYKVHKAIPDCFISSGSFWNTAQGIEYTRVYVYSARHLKGEFFVERIAPRRLGLKMRNQQQSLVRTCPRPPSQKCSETRMDQNSLLEHHRTWEKVRTHLDFREIFLLRLMQNTSTFRQIPYFLVNSEITSNWNSFTFLKNFI